MRRCARFGVGFSLHFWVVFERCRRLWSRAMRFFASAAALPSAAATGLARDAKRGCCGAKRPLATATSSAQLILNMICVFLLSLRQLAVLAASKSFYGVRNLLASPPRGQHESVVAVKKLLSLSTASRKTAYVSRAEFEFASRRCFELSLGEPQSPLAVHVCTRTSYACKHRCLVSYWA